MRILYRSNTQQHTTTQKNTQQHTTTVHNSTRVHKITIVPLFKKLWDQIFFCGTITLWVISRDILRGPWLFWPPKLRGQKGLGPLKMSLEMAQKVIVPQRKIMSRSFLNSGTLIVILHYKIIGAPKKFKSQPRPLVRPRSLNFSQNFWNLSHETVPLITDPEAQQLADPDPEHYQIGCKNEISFIWPCYCHTSIKPSLLGRCKSACILSFKYTSKYGTG